MCPRNQRNNDQEKTLKLTEHKTERIREKPNEKSVQPASRQQKGL
jgi:hypothetical protein